MKKFKLVSIICSFLICLLCSFTLNSKIEFKSNNITQENVLVRHTSYNETIYNSNVAIVSIFSYDGKSHDSSSSMLNINGHAFLTIENINSTTIKVGKMDVSPNETISIGTWGNKNQHKGIWYNLESYFANKGEYNGRVSLSKYTTSSELDTLNSYINSHDSWSLMSNCSSFASAAWNSISTIKLSPGWIDTPSNLKGSIKKHSYSSNKNIPYNNNVGYYTGDTFNYVNMDLKGILDSEMFNPYGL